MKKVGIIMGSDSDLPIIQKAYQNRIHFTTAVKNCQETSVLVSKF